MKETVVAAICKLAETSGEPLCAYVYDLQALAQHAEEMLSALPPGVELYYAAKANPDSRILSTLAPLVHGFEAASGGEMAWLHQSQPQVPIIFGGPGKLESELRDGLDWQIECFHVESLTELRRLARIAANGGRQARILLRMNIPLGDISPTRLAMGGKPTPFGLDQAELPQALRLISEEDGLLLKGFHFHLMSHQLCVDTHLALMSLYFRTFREWCREYGLRPPLLNVGGGMGVDYSAATRHFDWKRFCRELGELIRRNRLEDTTIRFECGRYVTAACGYYAMEVLDIKRNHGEYFAVGRGGTHHFRTPAAQGHSHPFAVIRGAQRSGEVRNCVVTLVGQLCTPKDVLATRQPVDSLAIGDYLVFPLAGAYAWNISHQNFLMHAPPQVVYL